MSVKRSQAAGVLAALLAALLLAQVAGVADVLGLFNLGGLARRVRLPAVAPQLALQPTGAGGAGWPTLPEGRGAEPAPALTVPSAPLPPAAALFPQPATPAVAWRAAVEAGAQLALLFPDPELYWKLADRLWAADPADAPAWKGASEKLHPEERAYANALALPGLKGWQETARARAVVGNPWALVPPGVQRLCGATPLGPLVLSILAASERLAGAPKDAGAARVKLLPVALAFPVPPGVFRELNPEAICALPWPEEARTELGLETAPGGQAGWEGQGSLGSAAGERPTSSAGKEWGER